MKHTLYIDKNADGQLLAIMGPIGSDGSVDCGYRIAGPKAWGGSKNIATLTIKDSDLVRYVKEYAPHLIEELNAR